jgi:hypothetical protein
MFQLACYELSRGSAKMIFVIFIEKGILAAPEQRLMDVHAAAIYAKDRFWHERRIDVMRLSDFFYAIPCRYDSIGYRQGIVIF